MAKVTNAGIAVRRRARERWAGALGKQAERERRVAAAVAAGLAAADERVAVDRRRDLAVEAARLAMVEAERVADRQRAAADERAADAVRALRAEGVSLARVAELLRLTVTDVRRHLGASAAGGPGSDRSVASPDPAPDGVA